MIASDLSTFGALPSKGMRHLFRDAVDGDVILVAGGENLAQTWYVMHQMLVEDGFVARLAECLERHGPEFTEALSRSSFGARQPFPYILSPAHFEARVRVMYNSVGGWPLRHYAPDAQTSILRDLARASFLSIRDEESAAIVHDLDPTLHPLVAPDCVFLLPGQFTKEDLARKASPEIRELVRQAGRFLTFQCHPRYGNANRDALKSQLSILANQTGLNILLTPIGRVYSFNDGSFLEPFAQDLGDAAFYLPDSATIWDIAYVLSAADLFCGTSLHGVITSLAYGVPFVSLENADPKLANNIRTWGLTGTFPQAAASAIADLGSRALNQKGNSLDAHAGRLREAAEVNMQSLAAVILPN